MKKAILSVLAVMTIALSGVLVSGPVFAGACSGGNQDDSCNKICKDTSIDQSVRDAAGCTDDSNDTLPSHLNNLVTAAVTVVGILAVLVIVVGGQRLVTSAGDPGKMKQAKDMILYAVIAVIIAGLAYALINFVAQAVGK